jgi:hypothetical protein
MSEMVLEYPFKIALFIAVILILVGIMWTFRDQIMRICLFPPCEESTEECDMKTSVSNENDFSRDILTKYCQLCWERNKRGQCKKDSLCYVVNVDNPSNPFLYLPLSIEVSQYCSVTCSRLATSVYVQYDFLNKKITIAC